MRYLFNEIYDNLLFETKEYINFLISREKSSRKQIIENIDKYVDDFIKNNILKENIKFKFIKEDEISYWNKKLDTYKLNKIVEKLKTQINEWFSPLTFDILEDGEISLNEYIKWSDTHEEEEDDLGDDAENHSLNLFYRINKTKWRTFVNNNPIQVNTGDQVEFVGDNLRISRYMEFDDIESDIEYIESGELNPYDNNYNYYIYYIVRNFSSTCKFNVHGNIASLLNSTEFYKLDNLTKYNNYCFSMLFYNCQNLVSAENLILPFNNLCSYCYSYMFMNCKSITYPPYMPILLLRGNYCCTCMFAGCDSLISTPEFTSTETSEGCYKYMFHGCTSLKKAYDLPANVVFERSYYGMFYGCTSLKKAPRIEAEELFQSSCAFMFVDCTSLKKAPKLYVEDLGEYCCEYMFSGCTSLKKAPELPATDLFEYCYCEMFSGCTSLTTAPTLPATTLDYCCYRGMFYGCKSLKTPPLINANILSTYCCYSMFENCTALKDSPILCAETLVSHCYENMFKGCAALRNITCYATNEINSINLREWVAGVAPTGTFYKKENVGFTVGASGIPYDWEVEIIEE